MYLFQECLNLLYILVNLSRYNLCFVFLTLILCSFCCCSFYFLFFLIIHVERSLSIFKDYLHEQNSRILQPVNVISYLHFFFMYVNIAWACSCLTHIPSDAQNCILYFISALMHYCTPTGVLGYISCLNVQNAVAIGVYC